MAAVFLLRAFVIEPFVVPTGSMESTIEVGDCILAQKITLETGSDLKPGDDRRIQESEAEERS